MTRLIAAAALAAAAFATPAMATPGGACSNTVDAACDREACNIREGCTTKFCVVVVVECLAQARI